MFEFITISNGVAVVQHAASGHVYRFRPEQPGHWGSLRADRIDATDRAIGSPHDHASAALNFAEAAVADLFRAAAEAEARLSSRTA